MTISVYPDRTASNGDLQVEVRNNQNLLRVFSPEELSLLKDILRSSQKTNELLKMIVG
jgi:hypothetical protein